VHIRLESRLDSHNGQPTCLDRPSGHCLVAVRQPATASHLLGMPKICELAQGVQLQGPVDVPACAWLKCHHVPERLLP